MRGKVWDQAHRIDGVGADIDGCIGGDFVKFNFKYALIAALIVGMLLGFFVIITCACNGEWGKFCIAAAFEFIMAFALGGLMDD